MIKKIQRKYNDLFKDIFEAQHPGREVRKGEKVKQRNINFHD